jgi:hypothetical protein
MKIRTHEPTTHERWANLRFSVVGHLLAAPPARGDLQRELERLAAMKWRHPVTGAPTTFGLSTIERWYYEARRAPVDPVGRLRQKVRKDLGRRIAITDAVAQAIHALYEANRSWSYQLCYDNLVAWAEADGSAASRPRARAAPSAGSTSARCGATRPNTSTASGTSTSTTGRRRCSSRAGST